MPSVIPDVAGRSGYFLIPASARTLEECPFTERDSELPIEEMYKLINCDMVQLVRVLCKDGKQLPLRRYQAVIDEDGRLRGKPLNAIGTVLYDNPNDNIVGDMLILCGKAQMR